MEKQVFERDWSYWVMLGHLLGHLVRKSALSQVCAVYRLRLQSVLNRETNSFCELCQRCVQLCPGCVRLLGKGEDTLTLRGMSALYESVSVARQTYLGKVA